ncbi:hypothetical protein CFN78_06760 [Amycolatopsis antarctica]|uniref:SAP domain-containing protein n=1 Tax=Amycolatopsis antarctica TaxID=1854586 RepID=A0A263D6D9_9PSEU|nr:SAP domain-containing protein [Amycolatopsis antarctica]OZM73983.1 hypothetical protein CFN78_06760 [Amycolatopsis antarctica]
MLTRRHTTVRAVEASDRFPEGGSTDSVTTYADTTTTLTAQPVDDDPSLFDDSEPADDIGSGEVPDEGATPTAGVDPDEHTGDELRTMASELGLPTSGSKSDLADRINSRLGE